MRRGVFIAACVLVLALFWGCGYKGENVAPENPFVYMYNVPPDSSVLGAAPIIYWWGTDRDGRIIEYEYIDIPKSLFAGGDELYESYYTGAEEIPDTGVALAESKHANWMTTSQTSDTIFLSLEAGEDTTEHLFCVRSVDNEGLKSDIECRIYFRINTPPDTVELKEYEEYEEGDTFWVLNDVTEDWGGIPFSWRAHDPDNSVILEYYWWVENYDNPNEVVRTSLADDSLGGMYSGLDSTDGWVRYTNTILRGIPTGHWRFVVKARDDAFYEGAADTFEFYAVHPYFDPSIDSVAQAMYEGTFPHRMLVLYAYSPTMGVDIEDVQSFYGGIFDQFVGMYYDSYDATTDGISFSGFDERLNMTKFDLKDYSIVYFVNIGHSAFSFAPLEEMLDEFREYVLAGGRLVLDGRSILEHAHIPPSAFSAPGYTIYEMLGVVTVARPSGFAWAQSLHPDFPDSLTLDADKVPGGTLGKVQGFGTYPYFFGVPFVEPLYRAGEGSSDDLVGWQVAERFARRTTRSAYFAFPLYFIDNSEGKVNQVLDETFRFITATFEPEEEEEEGL